MPYLSFEDAVNAVSAFEQKPTTKLEYFQLYNQCDGLPKYPDKVYQLQWKGWRHFLGTVKVEKYSNLDEAKAAVQRLNPIPSGFTSYRKVYRQDPKLPANPENRYKLCGWCSWPDFVGKRLSNVSSSSVGYYQTYSLAKLALRKLGVPSSAKAYKRIALLDPKLPPEPAKYYQGCGWNGWGKFLSNTFCSSLEQAISAVQDLYIVPITRDQYRSQYRYNPQLPREPDKFYSEAWQGWRHFLGTEQLMNNDFNALRIKTQDAIDGNLTKRPPPEQQDQTPIEEDDTVQLTQDTRCEYAGWSLPKGLMGTVLEIEDGIVMMECEVADDDHVHVKLEHLQHAETPSYREIFADIRHNLKHKGPGYKAFASNVSEFYQEMYECCDDYDYDEFHVTPVMLIYLFDTLPFQLKALAVTNMKADINNWEFTRNLFDLLDEPSNFHIFSRIKSMANRKA